MASLDVYASKIEAAYNACHQAKCLESMQKLRAMTESGSLFHIDKNKAFIVDNEENKTVLEDYNKCLTKCEKPANDLRFETELQLREFQSNLNDCFYFCRNQESGS